MIDQMIGLLLMGLGLKSPVTPGAVQGIQNSVPRFDGGPVVVGSRPPVGASGSIGKRIVRGFNKRDEALNSFNAKRVQQMRKMLEQIQKILTIVENKVNNSTISGDRTAYDSAVVAAGSAIAAASGALDGQEAKLYAAPSPTPGASASAVTKDFVAQRQQLNTDLKAVQTQIKAARDAVKTVVSEARKLVVRKAKVAPATPITGASGANTIKEVAQ